MLTPLKRKVRKTASRLVSPTKSYRSITPKRGKPSSKNRGLSTAYQSTAATNKLQSTQNLFKTPSRYKSTTIFTPVSSRSVRMRKGSGTSKIGFKAQRRVSKSPYSKNYSVLTPSRRVGFQSKKSSKESKPRLLSPRKISSPAKSVHSPSKRVILSKHVTQYYQQKPAKNGLKTPIRSQISSNSASQSLRTETMLIEHSFCPKQAKVSEPKIGTYDLESSPRFAYGTKLNSQEHLQRLFRQKYAQESGYQPEVSLPIKTIKFESQLRPPTPKYIRKQLKSEIYTSEYPSIYEYQESSYSNYNYSSTPSYSTTPSRMRGYRVVQEVVERLPAEQYTLPSRVYVRPLDKLPVGTEIVEADSFFPSSHFSQ